jgi:hypothetical protein
MAYREGKATKELARRFAIDRATVTVVLQRLGVELRQKGLSDEQATEARRLYPEGWSLARLAERYDCHRYDRAAVPAPSWHSHAFAP